MEAPPRAALPRSRSEIITDVQRELDTGVRADGLSSAEREEIRKLRKENFELRRANEILKAASLFFAAELDPHRPR